MSAQVHFDAVSTILDQYSEDKKAQKWGPFDEKQKY